MFWAWMLWVTLSFWQAVPLDEADSIAGASVSEAFVIDSVGSTVSAFACEVPVAWHVWNACCVACCVELADAGLCCTVSFHLGAVSTAAEESGLALAFAGGIGRSDVIWLLNFMCCRRPYLAAKASSQA